MEEYFQTSPKKKNLWPVTSILVSCIFAWVYLFGTFEIVTCISIGKNTFLMAILIKLTLDNIFIKARCHHHKIIKKNFRTLVSPQLRLGFSTGRESPGTGRPIVSLSQDKGRSKNPAKISTSKCNVVNENNMFIFCFLKLVIIWKMKTYYAMKMCWL